MESVIVYNTPHLIAWDWRIAADLFLGGIGAGAFLLAVANSLRYKDKYPALSRTGAIISPIAMIAGILFMMSELGHPLRMAHTMTGFNVTSPLSWGGPLQGLLIAIGVIYAFLWLKPVADKARKAIGIIGIPVALCVAFYHGWLLSALTARPLWNSGLVTLLAILAAATTGTAAVLLVATLTGKARTGETPGWMVRDVRVFLVGALAMQAVAFAVWWLSMYGATAEAREAVVVAAGALGSKPWLLGVVVGLLVPILLQIVDMARGREETVAPSVGLTALTTVLILVGGFVFRFVVISGGQLS